VLLTKPTCSFIDRLKSTFEVAGVNNIIMSMWNIDDHYTQYFMLIFYRNLIEMGDVTIAFGETLREARKLDPNPRLWGAFKLVVSN
ncbi:MAG: CHAT domain-containing protein, partial [Bacteroidota bacterium]